MENNNEKKAEAIKQAYAQARQMRDEGVPAEMIEDTIKKKLIEGGLEPAAAVMICSNLPGVREETTDDLSKIKKNIAIGVALLIVGVLITWISEIIAIKKGGGYYIIALGPIFTGLGIIIKGVFDYKSYI